MHESTANSQWHSHFYIMGLQRDSLISLVTFSSRGSKKGHGRTSSSSHKLDLPTETFNDENLEESTPLSSRHSTSSSGDFSRSPVTPQTPLDTPPRRKVNSWLQNYRCKPISKADGYNYFACPQGLNWEMLHEVLCSVSPEHPDFFAVYVDSTKAWYRGYLFNSDSELGKLVPFAVKYISTLGEPANQWLAKQSCSTSLRDSVRVVSLEWLFAIPGQRITELRLVQLIDELRRLRSPDQQVQFMNQVNLVLGLPIYSRTENGAIMPVGRYNSLELVKQQVSIACATSQSSYQQERKLEEWLPRSLEVELINCDNATTLDHCVLRLHLRRVTPQGHTGKRLSENYEVAFKLGIKCAFQHLLPASPSILAKLGRVVLVCELFDVLTTRYIGFGIVRMDTVLQPESLDRTFMLPMSLYNHSSPCRASVSTLYKSIITGGATGLKVPETVKELFFEISSKLRSHPSAPTVPSTINDYFNQSETVLMDFGELVVLKRPSILSASVNDPFLIRIEGRELVAESGFDVGLVLKFPVPLSHIDIQLLFGSTIVAASKTSLRDIPVAADFHRIPLFDTENDEIMVGFINVHQTYMGREQLQPPPVIFSILGHSFDFNLSAIDELGLADLKIWTGPMITSILTQLVDRNDTQNDQESTKLFKAFIRLLSLGISFESRYLFELYKPPRRILAAPVASIILQQYCNLLETQANDLKIAFEIHSLLGHFLDNFGVSPSEFRPLTQSFMALLSDDRASEKLLLVCLQHLDELYVVNMGLEIASQIGSVLTVASYISAKPVVVEFYWLLARVAKSKAYSTVFSQQFSSLVLSLTERFWNETGSSSQSLEEIRAMMALMISISVTSVEAPAFLSLCISVLVMNEPSCRAVPHGPLFEPYRDISVSIESERTTAIIETCLVIYELTDPKFSPSRLLLNNLEDPLDLADQLCLCANIMADSVAPYEWMSLNCVLLNCALRCVEYAGVILESAAIPDSTMQASLLDKKVWLHVFDNLFKFVSDPRINFGLVRVGMQASPIQRASVEQSVVLSGIKSVARLWNELSKGGRSGGYQVQFYDEYQFWGYLLLLGFNSERSTICCYAADMLGTLLDGEYKLYGTSSTEVLRTLLLSLNHMFRHLAPLPDSTSGLKSSLYWPRFSSIVPFLESSCHYISSTTFDVYGDALAIVLKAADVLRTYWSESYSRGTLIALGEVLEFIREHDAKYMFEEYFGDFVDAIRMGDQADERLAIAYYDAVCLYASIAKTHIVGGSLSPRLPPQPVNERRRTLVEMSLQYCVKAKSWKLAEIVMESESQWLKEAGNLEERSRFITKWLPTITAGLTHYNGDCEHNWYLVRFNGSGFGTLCGREFIWETRLRMRLSDAIHAVSMMFNNVTGLPWDNTLQPDTSGSYVAILTLSRENGRFVHMRPIHDQQTEFTEVEAMRGFPSVSGFIEIKKKYKHILGPEETALRDVRSKTEELRSVCTPQSFRQLDLVLSGILNAGVNGGMSRYSDLLSSAGELVDAFRELKTVVEGALEIYAQHCGDELSGQYNLLCERLRQWQSLNSMNFGSI